MADDEGMKDPETQPGAPPAAILSLAMYASGQMEANYPEQRGLAYLMLESLKKAMDDHFKRGEKRVALIGSMPRDVRRLARGG